MKPMRRAQISRLLAQGMKWSDGHPYTTEDVMFWYEDVFMNPDIEVTNQDHLVVGDDKACSPKSTIRNSGVVQEPEWPVHVVLAWADSDQTARFPKHYLSQFLPKYNPDADKLPFPKECRAGYNSPEEIGSRAGGDFFLNSEIPSSILGR